MAVHVCQFAVIFFQQFDDRIPFLLVSFVLENQIPIQLLIEGTLHHTSYTTSPTPDDFKIFLFVFSFQEVYSDVPMWISLSCLFALCLGVCYLLKSVLFELGLIFGKNDICNILSHYLFKYYSYIILYSLLRFS